MHSCTHAGTPSSFKTRLSLTPTNHRYRHYPLGYPSPAHAMVPMGALLKAVIVNSAQCMEGPEANAHNKKYGISFPNFDQGFGTVALKYAVPFEVRA